MKAALLTERGKITMTTVDTPAVGPEDVLIKVAYAGICGSDLHTYRGEHPFRHPPVILGHELSGTVAALGGNVQGLSLGERVTVMPVRACGQCAMCHAGKPNICLNKIVPGVGGWLGTFAEYFGAPASIVFKLGEHTSLKLGALAEPFAVGVHSVAQGRVASGERVLVLGAGTIGLVTAVAARLAGAQTVVITDLYDYNLTVARALGVDGTYNARDEALVETIGAQYPEKFDAVFLTGGAAPTVAQALALVRRAGRIVVTALFLKPFLASLVELTLYELELIGSQIYTQADYRAVLDCLDGGTFALDRLIDHVCPLDRAGEALEMVSTHAEDAIKVLLQPAP